MGQEEYQELSSFLRRFIHRFKLLQGAEGICLTAICALLLLGAGLFVVAFSAIVARVATIPGVEVQHASDRTFQLHRRGKIVTQNKVHIRTSAELSHVYTPGVARVSMAIAKNPDVVRNLTIKRNTVAVVTDGSAVLGLGNIGPEAAMPVMEGKAALFKRFANVDAWPICLATNDVDEIVRAVELIAPGFGGINLEDISAPRCFEVEKKLRDRLDIPVFHDDQHGTGIVVVAALRNALRLVQKDGVSFGIDQVLSVTSSWQTFSFETTSGSSEPTSVTASWMPWPPRHISTDWSQARNRRLLSAVAGASAFAGAGPCAPHDRSASSADNASPPNPHAPRASISRRLNARA